MSASLRTLPAVAALAVITGCAHDHEAADPSGTASFALTSVPSDVRCVKVSITGATRTVDKTYDVTPGQPSVYKATALPTGSVVVSGQAYPSTCAGLGTAVPDWIASPQTTLISPNLEAAITLTLERNGRAGISADFKDDNWTVSTFVGKGGVAGTTDGVGTSALLQSPWGLAVKNNDLYIQSWPGITRDVNLATAATTTLATEGAASGSVVLGNALYITDWWNNCVTKLDLATNTFAVFAGSGAHDGGAGYFDGVGTAARFYAPYGITTDGASLYVTDLSSTVRKIDPTTATVTTLAGGPWSIGAADGPLSAARFWYLTAITYTNGKLYLTDTGNHNIRSIDLAAGTVSTFAGSGAAGNADGVGTGATFYWPYGIAPDAHGNLYVTDNATSVVRKIVIDTGAVITIAGRPFAPGYADGVGAAARFSGLLGITLDAAENIYVSEFDNHTVRKLSRP